MNVTSFYFILLILSSTAFAESRGLPGLLKVINSPVAPVAGLCQDEDLYAQCALDLCGSPAEVRSSALTEANFKHYMDEEGLKKLDKVKGKLSDLLVKEIAQSRKSVADLKKRRQEGTLIPKFSELSEDEWERHARNVFTTKLDFNPFKNDENFEPRKQVSQEVKAGLKDFAKTSSCQSKTCRKGVEEYLSDLYGRKLDELSLKVENPKLLEERLPKCLSAFASTSLKKNQEAEFVKNLPTYYERFISKAMSGLSSHSKEAFRKYLREELKLEYKASGFTADDYFKELDSSLQNVSKTIDILSFEGRRGEMDPLATIRSLCPSIHRSVGTDAFMPHAENEEGETAPVLVVSLATQLDLKTRESIFHHELGHVLSHVVSLGILSKESQKEFLALRECARKLSPLDNGKPNHVVEPHSGDHYCTEEDTADLLSYKVSAEKPGPLAECVLLDQSQDRKSYEKVDLKVNNSHSPDIIRIIREAIHRNRTIPPSCKKIMEDQKFQYSFHKCS